VTSKRVKAIRLALGLTQQQLADRIAATQVTVARWETGVSRPTGAYLKALEELKKRANELALVVGHGKGRKRKGG
jgi:DNA-binding transcriptional regulator YiaG